MEVTQSTSKQLLIQLAINIVASAVVSYIMYKLLQPKDDTTAIAKQVSTTPSVTASPAPSAL